MKFHHGLDLCIPDHELSFRYGPGVFGPTAEMRRLDDIRPSLRDPHCDGPDPVYGIAMDVCRKEHHEDLRRRMLLFGAVVFAAGRLGEEPVRSQGSHPSQGAALRLVAAGTLRDLGGLGDHLRPGNRGRRPRPLLCDFCRRGRSGSRAAGLGALLSSMLIPPAGWSSEPGATASTGSITVECARTAASHGFPFSQQKGSRPP